MDVKAEKNRIRRLCRTKRSALSPELRAEYSAAIVRRLVQTPEYRAAKTVMLYSAVNGEVCLDALEEYNRGCGCEKTFLYPLIVSDTEMAVLKPLGSDAMRPGYMGIPEPVRELSDEFSPEDIDLVICPCTSFDSRLTRLGMGGGYYDRFLALCPGAFAFAVAFECQRWDELPAGEWDRSVCAVVTETGIYR